PTSCEIRPDPSLLVNVTFPKSTYCAGRIGFSTTAGLTERLGYAAAVLGRDGQKTCRDVLTYEGAFRRRRTGGVIRTGSGGPGDSRARIERRGGLSPAL